MICYLLHLRPSIQPRTRYFCREMNNLSVETGDTFSNLLDLAANDDVEGFKRSVECDPSSIDEIGLWYFRQKGSKQMVYEHRTPLMVASVYGSIDVVKLIVSLSIVDVNRSCGRDKSTALHCAASGGSENAVEVVKLLLKSGADVNAIDSNGHRPIDVITVSPKLQDLKLSLEDLLTTNGSFVVRRLLSVSVTSSPLSSSTGNDSPLSSNSESPPSPVNPISYSSEKKEYPIDPSIPDIKNSIYASDEFRMYQFKVRPCSRAYSHDWTECPFVHPGENARRRDPRKYHYSCVPCPDFRKGACRRGDMCEYAHGVFESWLHPAQYRTRLCKDGTGCNRRVCFFAHTHDELRPLYLSTGSGLSSPRSPMSPSNNGAWPPQQDVPSLRLPGSNLQSSRLRSSLNARDMVLSEDFDFELQQQRLLSELSFLSINNNNNSNNSLNRSNRSMRTLNPSNLDDLFSSESLSPRYADLYSPTRNPAVFNNQFQQSMLSPINTANASLSPRGVDPISPMSARSPSGSGSGFNPREHLHQFRSLSARDLYSNNTSSIVGSPVHSRSGWGGLSDSNDNKLGLSLGGGDETGGRMRRSSSFELGTNGEEPDLSWVQSLVKDSNPPFSGEEPNPMTSEHYDESVIAGWVQQMQT